MVIALVFFLMALGCMGVGMLLGVWYVGRDDEWSDSREGLRSLQLIQGGRNDAA